MIITVSGVVAYQSPDQIPGAVRAAIVRWAPQVVLIDVADVSLLDAATIAALVASHQTGAWAGIPVALINVGAFPLSQLRERGLASLLCPDLPTEDGGVVADSSAPASPVADRAQESPPNWAAHLAPLTLRQPSLRITP